MNEIVKKVTVTVANRTIDLDPVLAALVEVLPIMTMVLPANSKEGDTVPAVSLHKALEISTPLAKWCERTIESLELVEGVDYVVVVMNKMKEITEVQRVRREYHFTLQTAHNIAVISRNAMGKLVRTYVYEVMKAFSGLLESELRKQIASVKAESNKNKRLADEWFGKAEKLAEKQGSPSPTLLLHQREKEAFLNKRILDMEEDSIRGDNTLRCLEVTVKDLSTCLNKAKPNLDRARQILNYATEAVEKIKSGDMYTSHYN